MSNAECVPIGRIGRWQTEWKHRNRGISFGNVVRGEHSNTFRSEELNEMEMKCTQLRWSKHIEQHTLSIMLLPQLLPISILNSSVLPAINRVVPMVNETLPTTMANGHLAEDGH